MKLLLDTHLLLWAALWPERLSRAAVRVLDDQDNELCFSAASVWEITIKRGLGRHDFRVDPRLLRRGLLDNGYEEMPITSDHAVAVDLLPPIHKDPFDRLLVAQATVELHDFANLGTLSWRDTLGPYDRFSCRDPFSGAGTTSKHRVIRRQRDWASFNAALFRPDALAGDVATQGAGWLADQHGVIDRSPERPFNGFQVWLVAIGR